MKFTHRDTDTGRLCRIEKTWEGKFDTWAAVKIFNKIDNTISNIVLNYSQLEKLSKPVKKEIDYDFMSYTV